jgi:hypothetical protein
MAVKEANMADAREYPERLAVPMDLNSNTV